MKVSTGKSVPPAWNTVLMNHRGFTLVEVMIALVILTVAILGVGQLTVGMVHTAAIGDRHEVAAALAADQLERVRLDPNYGVLESLYVATESNFPALPGFLRATQVVHVGGPGQPTDYKKVTVTVWGPGLAAPLARSTTVAAP